MKGESSSTGDLPDIPYSAEVKRKLVHLCSLLIPIGIWFLPKTTAVWVLGIAFAISVVVDVLRHTLPVDIQWWRHLMALFRPKEKGKLSGSSYLLLAALLLVIFFSRGVTALSLTYMVVGDVASALVGRRFGRHSLFDKTWEGSIAFFLACLIFSPLVPNLPFWVKLSAAAVAAIIEFLPIKLDDNLTVPLGTAGFLTLIS